MPFFLSFFMALQSLIRLALVSIALHSAVSEATKELATHLYPVRLMVQEAEKRIGQTKSAAVLQNVLDRARSAREQVQSAETASEQYAEYIPDSILVMIEWEKRKREQLELYGVETFNEVKERTFDPLVRSAFTSIVYGFADHERLQKGKLHVTSVELPSLDQEGEAYVGIEARYDFPLAVPFFHQTIHLYKKAYERAWIQ